MPHLAKTETGMQTWTIRDLITWTTGHFSKHGISSPRLDAEVLLGYCLGWDRVKLYVNFDKPLLPAELAAYREVVKRRVSREPVAYIIGRKEFYSLSFKVSPAVLIPRPDTELLVETAISLLKDRPAEGNALSICDIGTGSGAILLALGHHCRDATLWGTDISEDALALARENAEQLGLSTRTSFIRADILPDWSAGERCFSCIISNPPYIPRADIASLEPEINKFEPRVALDGGDDGLTLYRRIISRSWEFLDENGIICLEIGEEQADPVIKILDASHHYDGIDVRKDFAGKDRVIVAHKRH